MLQTFTNSRYRIMFCNLQHVRQKFSFKIMKHLSKQETYTVKLGFISHDQWNNNIKKITSIPIMLTWKTYTFAVIKKE